LYPGKKNESIKRKWTSRCQVHLFATSHPLSTSTLLQYKGEFNLKERKHKILYNFFFLNKPYRLFQLLTGKCLKIDP
jgi:hypothetical protein